MRKLREMEMGAMMRLYRFKQYANAKDVDDSYGHPCLARRKHSVEVMFTSTIPDPLCPRTQRHIMFVSRAVTIGQMKDKGVRVASLARQRKGQLRFRSVQKPEQAVFGYDLGSLHGVTLFH